MGICAAKQRHFSGVSGVSEKDPKEKPLVHKKAVRLAAVETQDPKTLGLPSKVSNEESISGLSRPDQIAIEMQRQSFFELDPNNRDFQCFLCNGTGKRDISFLESSETKVDVAPPVTQESKIFRLNSISKAIVPPPPTKQLKFRKEKSTEGKQHGKVIKTSKTLDPSVCWVCEGSGQVSKYFERLQIESKQNENDVDAPECLICWGDGEYGLSTECDHFFCKKCLAENLNETMQQGKFPAFCPGCQEATADGKPPICGKITGQTLSFFTQRDIITSDFQSRFMMQQINSFGTSKTKKIFLCPKKGCNTALVQPPEIQWAGGRSNPVPLPGQCVTCSSLVCLLCHQLVSIKEADSHVSNPNPNHEFFT